ncbi:MAG: hypothetical protein LBQ95_02805 [Lachnospiraceae bacterium]|nr:hypothetical protein [Lachnospiraceae bacterium]
MGEKGRGRNDQPLFVGAFGGYSCQSAVSLGLLAVLGAHHGKPASLHEVSDPISVIQANQEHHFFRTEEKEDYIKV